MYEKVPANLDFVSREKAIEAFWKENRIFEKSMEMRKGSPVYSFYDGPPTANGMPHIGHVLTRVIKDMIPRYATMKGNYVLRKAGWDTHGLPVELEVEKLLGLDGKEQIEEYGLIPFIDKCKESVWKYKGMWEDFSRTVGYWVDMDDPYVTYHNDYIESVWWSLKQVWDKGLLYKGYKVVPYCPRCGTPLSSHETAQGYKDVKEKSCIVKFKVKGEDAYFLAWTTTPWTLPSNVGLCVGPEFTYVRVKKDGEVYIMAEGLLSSVMGEDAEVEILEKYTGKDLEYKEYEPLFPFANVKKKAFFVTCADYVTLSDGTGIVHIAPAFGEDDAQVGRRYDLPLVQFVDQNGNLTKETWWEGMFVKDADPLIIEKLKEMGMLFKVLTFEHNYPHCWRCGTPLLYYARESWFIRMTAVKDQLIANNNTINWIPESIGKGRFGDWLENIQDWGISRNRYWGTPLNVWECACGHQHSIGSIAELKEMSDNCPDDIELHRPYIDAVTIKCPVCGGEMKRVEEVIDCWYDSGAMPFAQFHYPFENKDLFEQNFPADFISEAVDQTRGWFYSLLAISTLLFNKAPYKNVIVLGHVQDENGQKMSKSKGNAVNPFDALATHGADAIRWYFYENSAPWLPNRFYKEAVSEGQRKFMGTLWNTYAFYVLYAEIDQFDPTKHELRDENLTRMDRWILSRLNSVVKACDENLSSYRIPETARILQDFVDELSNWYVRRGRSRYWGEGITPDKEAAYMTLYTCLVTIAKAAAPMIPFMTEDIYRNLVAGLDPNAPESIHLCAYPEVDESRIDKDLEERMATLLEVVTLGRSARSDAALKNRQPLSTMYVSGVSHFDEADVEIIRGELNVKDVVISDDTAQFVTYTFKPQLRTMGPRFGKRLGEVRNLLSALDGSAAKAELDANGFFTLHMADGDEKLTADDVLMETAKVPGYVTMSDGKVQVALYTVLTPELIQEGLLRETVSKIQTMRKDAGFNVTDRITVGVVADDELTALLKGSEASVCKDVLADAITFGETRGFVKEWDLNGHKATLSVEKVK